jgi:hypothetical protein
MRNKTKTRLVFEMRDRRMERTQKEMRAVQVSFPVYGKLSTSNKGKSV